MPLFSRLCYPSVIGVRSFRASRYLSENALRFLTGINKKKMAKTRLKRTLPQAIKALNKLQTIKTTKQ